MPKKCNSPVHVLQMLSCEGLTRESEKLLKKYNEHNVSEKMNDEMKERALEAKQILRKLSQEERMIIGLWIRDRVRGALDSGIRIGLGTRLAKEE